MAISSSASNNDASNFTITETLGGNVSTRQGNLSLSQTITYGTGTLEQGNVQANAFCNNTGVISGSNSLQIDFRAITQSSAKSTYTVEYDQIRTIRFSNTSSTTGTQLYIRATGANALSGGVKGEFTYTPAGPPPCGKVTWLCNGKEYETLEAYKTTSCGAPPPDPPPKPTPPYCTRNSRCDGTTFVTKKGARIENSYLCECT